MEITFKKRYVPKDVRPVLIEDYIIHYSAMFIVGMGVAKRYAEEVIYDIQDLFKVKHELKKRINDYLAECDKRFGHYFRNFVTSTNKMLYDDLLRLAYDNASKDIAKLENACINRAKEMGIKNHGIVGKIETANLLWLITEENIKYVFKDAEDTFKFNVRASELFDFTRVETCRAKWLMLADTITLEKDYKGITFDDDKKVCNCMANMAKKIYSDNIRQKSLSKAIKLNEQYLDKETIEHYREIQRQTREYIKKRDEKKRNEINKQNK